MRPYLITAKLMRPSNMKRFPTPGLDSSSGALLLCPILFIGWSSKALQINPFHDHRAAMQQEKNCFRRVSTVTER
jgi:hypothetical protein